MRIFHCDNCSQLVFFENVQCVKCRRVLAYLPDLAEVGSLVGIGDNVWRACAPNAAGRTYRLCRNYSQESVCNWALPDDDSNPYCLSCRLTRTIPKLDVAGNRTAWFALESAKRRLVYSLIALGLPLVPKSDDAPFGLAFEFLADPEPDSPSAEKILTEHADGVVTINIAEADDAEREKRRLAMHEPYRTLLGHFRHEVGHYYWDRLIRDSDDIEAFRALFGDEREDYGAALGRHYANGAPADWQERFVSSYSSSHPWEDWAETWAHYLHLTDTLEMATECGLALLPNRHNRRPTRPRFTLCRHEFAEFDDMLADWFGVTYLLNNLNRGLGLKDSYPFVLSTPTIEKLRFVDEICRKSRSEE